MTINHDLLKKIKRNSRSTTPEALYVRRDISANDLCDIGLMYMSGDQGIKQNYEKARQFFEKSLKKGSSLASRQLGLIYECGYGVTQNGYTSFKYYLKAIEIGYSKDKADKDINDAINHKLTTGHELNLIGVTYGNGDDIAKDYQKARECYQLAIKKGNANACRNMAILYHYGLGVPKDIVSAVKYYQLAINKGLKTAQKDIEVIMNADETTVTDLNSIGMVYHNGDKDLVIEQDYEKAKQWYEKAMAKGCGAAYRNCALLYKRGLGVKREIPLAIKYFQKAIDNYNYPNAVEDIERTLNWEEITADQLNSIGVMYMQDEEIAKNAAQAQRCYRLAIARGSVVANQNLGMHYELGRGVLNRSYIAATYYYQRAIDKGHSDTHQHLADVIEKMSITEMMMLAHAYHHGTTVTIHEEVFIFTTQLATALQWYIRIIAKSEQTGYSDLAETFYNLAGLYQKLAIDDPKNWLTAAKYLLESMRLGYVLAEQDLLKLQLSTQQWFDLGASYYAGMRGEKDQSYFKARICFEQVVHKNSSHNYAHRILGSIYEEGKEVEKNLIQARKHYELGQSKRDYKRVERSIIWQAAYQFNEHQTVMEVKYDQAVAAIQVKDEQGRTALRRAADNKALKLYAQLLCIEADPELHDVNKRYPASSLSQSEKKQANRLSKRVNAFKRDYSKSAGAMLADIASLAAGWRDSQKAAAALDELFLIPEIKPLTELAKLACMGRHRLSKRKEHQVDESYDSDTEAAVSDDHRLSISVSQKGNCVDVFVDDEKLYVKCFSRPAADIAVDTIHMWITPGDRKIHYAVISDINGRIITGNLEEPAAIGVKIETDEKLHAQIEKELLVQGHITDRHGGLYGKGALGLYDNDNAIYVAGNRISEAGRDSKRAQMLFKGTLIHELCHFAAKEVFDNACKPYKKNDSKSAKEFSKIVQDMELRGFDFHRISDISKLDPNTINTSQIYIDELHNQYIVRDKNGKIIKNKISPEIDISHDDIVNCETKVALLRQILKKDKVDIKRAEYSLDPIFMRMFQQYEPESYHSETIVRVAQLIVHNSDGESILETQEPALVAYYRNTFMPALVQHIDLLEQRAVGVGWGARLFKYSEDVTKKQALSPNKPAEDILDFLQNSP